MSALASAVVVIASAPAGADFGQAVHLFDFQHPIITESSGVAASAMPGIVYTHNDSGGASEFYAVDGNGDLAAFYVVAHADHPAARWRAIDWEDMAAGPGRSGPRAVWLADIGDNGRNRPSVLLHEVVEPDRLSDAVLVARSYAAVYEDGPHDAEAFFVLPDGTPGIVTKESSGVSGVYLGTFVASVLTRGTFLFARVGEIDFDPIASAYVPGLHFSVDSRVLATGADVSADGTRLVVRTYVDAFEWQLPDGDIAAGLATAPVRIQIPYTQQGEAVSYDTDGRSILLTSEGVNAPVHRVPG